MSKIMTTFKSKLLVLLLAIIMLPCVFVLSACGKDNPKAGDPAKINASTLQSQLSKLNSYKANVLYDYELSKHKYENGIEVLKQSKNYSEINPITIKVNGNDYMTSCNYGDFIYDEYVIDGVKYNIDDGYDDVYDYASVDSNLDSTSKSIGFVSELDTMLPIFIGIAQETGNYSLVYGENQTKIMTLSCEIDNEINALIKFFVDNKDLTFETILNNLAGTDFDIVETIKSLINGVNDNSTFGDIINALSLNYDIDLVSFLPLFQSVVDSFANMSSNIKFDEETALEWNDGVLMSGCSNYLKTIDLESMLTENIFETLGMDKNELIEKIELYLTSEDYTIDSLIREYILNTEEETLSLEEYESFVAVLEVLNIQKSNVEIKIEFNKKDEIKAIVVDFDGEVKMVEDEENFELYSLQYNVIMDLSNVGKTTIVLPNVSFYIIDLQFIINYDELISNDAKVIVDDHDLLDSFTFAGIINDDEEVILSYDKDTKTFTFGSYIYDLDYTEHNVLYYDIYNTEYYITFLFV